MSESVERLRGMLEAKVKERGMSIRKISTDTGIGYFKLWRFLAKGKPVIAMGNADKLHAYLTGEPMIGGKGEA